MARIRPILSCLLLAGTLALYGAPKVTADEPQHLRLSIRALGMGNAFVAAANDESSLFYNPAGLASVKRSMFEILSVNATLNQNLIDLSQADSDESTAKMGEFVGEKLYVEAGTGLLSFTAPYWGYSFFNNLVLDQQVHNPTVPYFETLAYVQAGLIGGFAFTLWDQSLDVGVSMKYVQRAGIGKTVHIVDLLDDDFADNIQDEFVNTSRISPDVGVTYHYDRFYNAFLSFSAVMKNIGGMDFGSTGTLPTTIDFGVASESEVLGVDVIGAVDLVDATYQATEKKSFQRNLNMGMELGFWPRSNNHHALALRFGRKGPYTTTGLSLNPPYLPFMIDYASWSEEVGAAAGAKEDKRTSVQISFNF
ncbi:MAG: conjugal transfer protein TraF [bacterium]|nr:conjugal transfer protein TraF [bacterium]